MLMASAFVGGGPRLAQKESVKQPFELLIRAAQIHVPEESPRQARSTYKEWGEERANP